MSGFKKRKKKKNQAWITSNTAEASLENISAGKNRDANKINFRRLQARVLWDKTSCSLPVAHQQKYPFLLSSKNSQQCNLPSLHTCGRQSGRDSKITRRTPIGTVTCSKSRSFAIRVRRITRPTLSCEDAAIWRRPIAKLFSFDVDRLRRFNKGSANLPKRKKKLCWRYTGLPRLKQKWLKQVVNLRKIQVFPTP